MREALLACVIVGLSSSAQAQPPAAPTYWQDVRPLLRKHCTVCHSAKNLKEADVSGGLALDTFELTKKGSTKPVLAPGKSGDSLLFQVLVTSDVKKRMPLDAKPLPPETIDLIKRWIDAGAKEGTPTEDITIPKTGVKSTTVRKLDVLLKTDALPPVGFAGIKKAAKLDLALKVGPLSPIAAVAFSPDNKLLAAGSYGQVAIWDLAKAQPVKVLTNVLGAVHDVKFSPNGDILAVAGGQPSGKGEIRLFHKGDWKLRATLRGHDDVAFSVAFSPDGKRLASASFDHSVRLWDLGTHQTVQSYPGHSDFVYAIAFSPDGKHLATSGKDRIVKLMEVESGKALFTMSDREQDVMALAFHPDGKSIVASGYEPGITWWNPASGEKLRGSTGHGVAVHELAFSKDGKRLVSAAADRTVRVWDGAAGTVLKTLAVGSIAYSCAISSNNKLVASGSFDGLVKLWDEATGRHLATLLALPTDGDHLDWLAVTPEGYAAASDSFVKLGQWRMAGAIVPGEPLWPVLRQPDMVARAVQGQAVAIPKFEPGKK